MTTILSSQEEEIKCSTVSKLELSVKIETKEKRLSKLDYSRLLDQIRNELFISFQCKSSQTKIYFYSHFSRKGWSPCCFNKLCEISGSQLQSITLLSVYC